MNVITITRPVGSWGDYIGVDVAKALNMRYIDREIISSAASRAGISEETIERFKEPRSFVSRIVDSISKMSLAPTVPSQALRQSDYYTSVASSGAVRNLMLSGFSQVEAVRHEVAKKFPEARALEMIRTVVTEFARKGDVVLAGSGSQMFLQDWPNVLHVLIIAPMEKRVEAIMEQEGVTREVAERRVKENDEVRTAYMHKHFKADWLQFDHYHLVINTGLVSRPLAAELIIRAAQNSAPKA